MINKNLNDENLSEVSKSLLTFLNKSFLSRFINSDLDITDISFNGKDLYIFDNFNGRYRVDGLNLSTSEVLNFTRQIANLLGKNFNHMNPILDVSFDRYRLSAVYTSIAKSKNQPVITFSLRIRYEKLRIKENDTKVCKKEVFRLLNRFIKSHLSILISGPTGSGKTELQKYLVSLIDQDEKIILIEDSYETCLKELFPNHDITAWITSNTIGISDLVKVALRNQPDWLIVAETRGEEVIEMIESVSTGHPLITTLHASDPFTVFDRIYNMGKSKIKLSRTELHSILADYFSIIIQTKRVKVNGSFQRTITEIVEVYKDNNEIKFNLIYQNNQNEYMFKDLSLNLANKLNINPRWYKEA